MVRIGNGCGFWGDNLDAPLQLVRAVELDFLTLEYLAELTMSILAQQKLRDPDAGFAADFLSVLQSLREVPRLPKIITNAGGMNPQACALNARQILGGNARVAVVQGDDLLPALDTLLARGEPLAHLDTGEPLSSIRDRVVSANAYLGAGPIVQALAQDADVVITGRVADASLAVAPAVHAYGWRWDDWDRLASATVAGHLIECGAQVTGGLWCRWQQVRDWFNLGYPYVGLQEDGSFELASSNPASVGVNRETFAEQLLYEVYDPARYYTPDVIADFTSVQVEETGSRSVRVGPARGLPASATYKVSIAYRDGFATSGTLVIAGPDAAAKGRIAGEAILARAGGDFWRSYVELIGAGACVPGVVAAPVDPPEVVLRVAVHDPDRRKVERFAKAFAPLVTSGPPGVTGYTTGRPPVREVFAYWPALVKKELVQPSVEVLP